MISPRTAAPTRYGRAENPPAPGKTTAEGRIIFAPESNYDAQSIYYNVAGYSLLNLRLGVKHDSWQGGFFISNALDKHAETELPLANGVDLPIQRRIALNRPRTIGLDIRFDR